MQTNHLASVAVATLVLAGLAVALKPGSTTGAVLAAAGNSWATIIRAAAYGK